MPAPRPSGEPGQMNDAELRDGDLIWGLFSMPLWVNRLRDAARVRSQRKLKVKVTRPRHCHSSHSVIGALFSSVGRNKVARRAFRSRAERAYIEYLHAGNNEVGATGTNEELNSILMLQI